MKHHYFSFLVLLLIGCKSFERSIDKPANTLFSYLLPDSCDALLIKELVDYRSSNLTLPDSSSFAAIHNALSNSCKQTMENVRSLSYGNDSLDFVFIKNFPDTTLLVRSAMKGYRLIFEQDTLQECRIIHSNTAVNSELWPTKTD